MKAPTKHARHIAYCKFVLLGRFVQFVVVITQKSIVSVCLYMETYLGSHGIQCHIYLLKQHILGNNISTSSKQTEAHDFGETC